MCVEMEHVAIISLTLNTIYGENSILSRVLVLHSVFFHCCYVNYRMLQNIGTLNVSLGVVSPTNSVY